MSDTNTTTAMYCHACHNQWQRQADTIECPTCSSASTEIITPENDPRHFHSQQSPESSSAPVAPQPTPTTNAPSSSDQGESGATAPESPSSGGTQTQAQGHQEHTQPPNAQRPEFVFMFPQPTIFFTTIMADSNVPPPNAAGPRGPPVAHFGLNFIFPPMPHMAHGSTPTAPPPTGATTPGHPAEPTTQENPNQQEQPQGQPQQSTPHPPTGMPPGMPSVGPVPFSGDFLNALLASIFNPAAAIAGDAVYSQEALDRIINQLREQAGPGGAPPASQTAIDKLKVCDLDEKMLGGETKTRCVICVDEMGVGEKASVLPCSHFFHGECVTPWLKQHNTCPVCRRSVEAEASKVGKAAEVAEGEAPRQSAEAGCP